MRFTGAPSFRVSMAKRLALNPPDSASVVRCWPSVVPMQCSGNIKLKAVIPPKQATRIRVLKQARAKRAVLKRNLGVDAGW